MAESPSQLPVNQVPRNTTEPATDDSEETSCEESITEDSVGPGMAEEGYGTIHTPSP